MTDPPQPQRLVVHVVRDSDENIEKSQRKMDKHDMMPYRLFIHDFVTKQTVTSTRDPAKIQAPTLTKKRHGMDDGYRRIGMGFCGSVWAAEPGSDDVCAIKREDGGPGRSLWMDYLMHREVFKALVACQSRVSVPRCHLSSEPDEDCLIRLYLGRIRWRRGGSKIAPFSLRNDPLHLDQIESLELDFNLYAMILAEALADLYWRAHVDAKDVEFVLASPWEGDTIHDEGAVGRPARIHSVYLGEHAVWILDIDCCRDMQMDVQGVQQAMEAFYQNDPYFPRPGGRTSMEQTLWTIFRDHFLQTSEDIIGRGSPEADLPALWVDLVEIEGSYRAKLRRHL
ncbi:MAG: hypothetical protein L6R40_000870 [Gallowayella cf. fulva]|nr:MAG: hypothetical protein L6R40_000870 [Xanthomendoza cf. fulva]